MPSVHRLRRGLPGYLIQFAPHAVAPQCQPMPRWLASPLVFLPISTHFTTTPAIPPPSASLQSGSLHWPPAVKPRAFTAHLPRPPAGALRPVTPDNACPLCLTAAAGTELAGACSEGTVHFFPPKSGLQPEGRRPARGVARSGLPPLTKIPCCCLP